MNKDQLRAYRYGQLIRLRVELENLLEIFPSEPGRVSDGVTGTIQRFYDSTRFDHSRLWDKLKDKVTIENGSVNWGGLKRFYDAGYNGVNVDEVKTH